MTKRTGTASVMPSDGNTAYAGSVDLDSITGGLELENNSPPRQSSAYRRRPSTPQPRRNSHAGYAGKTAVDFSSSGTSIESITLIKEKAPMLYHQLTRAHDVKGQADAVASYVYGARHIREGQRDKGLEALEVLEAVRGYLTAVQDTQDRAALPPSRQREKDSAVKLNLAVTRLENGIYQDRMKANESEARRVAKRYLPGAGSTNEGFAHARFSPIGNVEQPTPPTGWAPIDPKEPVEEFLSSKSPRAPDDFSIEVTEPIYENKVPPIAKNPISKRPPITHSIPPSTTQPDSVYRATSGTVEFSTLPAGSDPEQAHGVLAHPKISFLEDRVDTEPSPVAPQALVDLAEKEAAHDGNFDEDVSTGLMNPFDARRLSLGARREIDESGIGGEVVTLYAPETKVPPGMREDFDARIEEILTGVAEEEPPLHEAFNLAPRGVSKPVEEPVEYTHGSKFPRSTSDVMPDYVGPPIIEVIENDNFVEPTIVDPPNLRPVPTQQDLERIAALAIEHEFTDRPIPTRRRRENSGYREKVETGLALFRHQLDDSTTTMEALDGTGITEADLAIARYFEPSVPTISEGHIENGGFNHTGDLRRPVIMANGRVDPYFAGRGRDLARFPVFAKNGSYAKVVSLLAKTGLEKSQYSEALEMMVFRQEDPNPVVQALTESRRKLPRDVYSALCDITKDEASTVIDLLGKIYGDDNQEKVTPPRQKSRLERLASKAGRIIGGRSHRGSNNELDARYLGDAIDFDLSSGTTEPSNEDIFMKEASKYAGICIEAVSRNLSRLFSRDRTPQKKLERVFKREPTQEQVDRRQGRMAFAAGAAIMAGAGFLMGDLIAHPNDPEPERPAEVHTLEETTSSACINGPFSTE